MIRPHALLEGVPVVMTTDFVITLKTPNGLIDIVRTIKPANKLTKRTLELFEIEIRFFAEQGINWGIILGNNLPDCLISNIEWVHDGRYLDTRPGVDEELVNLINPTLLQRIIQSEGEKTSISKFCLRCDQELGIQNGTSMFVLKHMLSTLRRKNRKLIYYILALIAGMCLRIRGAIGGTLGVNPLAMGTVVMFEYED